jgi:hypothetical protein
LALTYPDMFAASMPFAGPPICGVRVFGDATGPAGPGRCTDDGDTRPLVANARWLPYIISDGAIDQLVPFTGVLQQIRAFDDAGLRYHFEAYPVEDHLVYAVQDGFSSQVAKLGHPTVVRDPGTIHYTWYPDLTDTDLGLGPTGVYWLRDLVARDRAPGRLATVDATSFARPAEPHVVVRTKTVAVPGDPTPAVVKDAVWKPTGPKPAAKPILRLRLTDVSAVTVDLQRAGFGPTRTVTATVTTDGPTTLRFVNHGAPAVVTVNAGTTTVTLPA